MGEFELIARYFTRPPAAGGMVARGVGDDCAVLDLGDRWLALTTDMLVEGRHFFAGAEPEALGHKALAVNLSDLAAAGAAPRCFFLALALPQADEVWLAAFSRGMLALADAHGCTLAGGDTTRSSAGGPLTICITAVGETPPGAALSRAGALVGDDLWVSGEVGDAALALERLRSAVAPAQAGAQCLCSTTGTPTVCRRPEPRVALGLRLRGLASSCIDVSDGLLGDLGHIRERSGVGAELLWSAVPRSPTLRAQPQEVEQRCALAGGDDYELLFTAAPAQRDAVQTAGAAAGVAVKRIGRITAEPGCRVLDADGRMIDTAGLASFDHFAP
jgi:thiamine-monophosphate kinase